MNSEEEQEKPQVTADTILEAIEEAYPNSVTIDDMSRRFQVTTELAKNMVMELVTKDLVKAVGVGGSPAGVDTAAGAIQKSSPPERGPSHRGEADAQGRKSPAAHHCGDHGTVSREDGCGRRLAKQTDLCQITLP